VSITQSTQQRSLWQALFAFLALPGTVAFLFPWMLRPRGVSLHAAGMLPFIAGLTLLLWCVRDFYVAGLGTLAPWAPPTRLVVVGLYRVSRNPMYLGVLLILCGWAMAYASSALWWYTLIIATSFHLRVVLHEEPFLARTHGREWLAYKQRVPRWIDRARTLRSSRTFEWL